MARCRLIQRHRRVCIGPAAAMLGRAVLFQKRVVGESPAKLAFQSIIALTNYLSPPGGKSAN